MHHENTADKSPRSYLAPWAGPQKRVYCCRPQLRASGPGSLLEPSASESHWALWDPPPSCWNSCRPSPRLRWWREIAYTLLTRGQTFLKICQLWSLFIAARGAETQTSFRAVEYTYIIRSMFCIYHLCSWTEKFIHFLRRTREHASNCITACLHNREPNSVGVVWNSSISHK